MVTRYNFDLSAIRALGARGTQLQERLRTEYGTIKRRTDYGDQFDEPEEMTKVRYTIQLFAEEAHAKYPQYKGHWDKWKLARAIRRMTFKGGAVIESGDYILVSPTAHVEQLEGGFAYCAGIYGLRDNLNGCGEVSGFEIL